MLQRIYGMVATSKRLSHIVLIYCHYSHFLSDLVTWSPDNRHHDVTLSISTVRPHQMGSGGFLSQAPKAFYLFNTTEVLEIHPCADTVDINSDLDTITSLVARLQFLAGLYHWPAQQPKLLRHHFTPRLTPFRFSRSAKIWHKQASLPYNNLPFNLEEKKDISE